MSKWSGSLEAGSAWNYRMRPDVEEHPVTCRHPRPSVVEMHLECFRRHKTSGPHDELRAARLAVLQMPGDHAVNHVALGTVAISIATDPVIVPNCAA